LKGLSVFSSHCSCQGLSTEIYNEHSVKQFSPPLAPYASLVGETHLSCEQLLPFAGTLGGASVLHLVILLASWMAGHVG